MPFAVAADHVVAREDVVFNPYYQHMGGLYGSEYWTYILPRRVGAEMTAELTSAPFNPIGTRRAKEIGLIDDVFGADLASFRTHLLGLAERLARHADLPAWLAEKKRRRAADEAVKPIAVYRAEEMAKSHECFFGPDRSYHEARRAFVWKTGAPCAVPVAATPEPVFVANTAPAPEPVVGAHAAPGADRGPRARRRLRPRPRSAGASSARRERPRRGAPGAGRRAADVAGPRLARRRARPRDERGARRRRRRRAAPPPAILAALAALLAFTGTRAVLGPAIAFNVVLTIGLPSLVAAPAQLVVAGGALALLWGADRPHAARAGHGSPSPCSRSPR